MKHNSLGSREYKTLLAATLFGAFTLGAVAMDSFTKAREAEGAPPSPPAAVQPTINPSSP